MDLNSAPGFLIRMINDSVKNWKPLQASLELTNRCNERCTHCYLPCYEDDPRRLLTLEQWKSILSQLRSAGTLYLILMGGEAMLSPYFWEIAQDGVEKGFAVSMITNGLKITGRDVAERLADVGFSQVTVSLYSLTPEVHDAMTTVKGSHGRTMAAIGFLREAGVPIGVNCLLTKNNIRGFFDLADWCLERGIEIKGDPAVTPKLNGDPGPTYLRASREQLQWYYETVCRKWPAGVPKPMMGDKNDYICSAGKSKCAVTAHGELLTCIEIRESLGQLTEKNFEELWYGPVAQKWRSLKVKDLKDAPAGSVGSFCDHCPGMAFHETGDSLKVSKFFQDLAATKDEIHDKFGGEKGEKGNHGENKKEI